MGTMLRQSFGRRVILFKSSLVQSTAPWRCRSTKPAPVSRFANPDGTPAYEDDWCEEPEYPKINPETRQWNDYRREKLQKVLDYHARIKNASCPEEKNLEINMPRRFGYKVFQLKEDYFAYDCLPAYKFVTRTHIASKTQLPNSYSTPELNEKVEYFKQKIKEPLLDAINFELEASRHFQEDFNEFPQSKNLKQSQSMIPQINRVILSVLGHEVDYLKNCQVDVQPRVEAFWQIGGQEPSTVQRNIRKGYKDLPKHSRFRARYVEPDDPVEIPLHYVGNTLLQVRCKDPPKVFLNPNDPLCKRSIEEFPDRFPHFLQSYGFKRPDDYRFASMIPGHWSGDERRCNLISFHPRHYLKIPERAENKYWSAQDETEETLFSQAILVSFGRLVSQALYHGFDQYTDLEYPFSIQTIITDGLDWSFFAFQLNTMKLDQRSLSKNDKQNVIWGTQSQPIFDKEKKGELNNEVLDNLLRFYLNSPHKVSVDNPTPYLGSRLQDWEDLDHRASIFYNFREQVCQRPYVTDSLLKFRPPEMYQWERIYKFYFNAMPMEARRRFFELPSGFPGSNPTTEPYQMRRALYECKGIRRQRAELAEKKEKEAIEAAKKAEALKYGVRIDDKPRPRN